MQSGTRFFPVNNSILRMVKIEIVNLSAVNNNFKSLCDSGTLDLEVITKTPRTAKVLGSKLTVPVFFLNC